jgi:uncharacterized protein CbrC (UPF0167 family)
MACSGRKNEKINETPQMDSLPQFKYNPNAVKLGIIKMGKTNCPVCEKERPAFYNGSFYAVAEVEGICPWCIQDGSAAQKYDGAFLDAAACEPVEKKEYLMELITRTPGYTAWQQESWLSHCGDFCALKDYVGWTEIKELKDELVADLDQIKSDFGLTQDELETHLKNNGHMQGYLFQCIHCGKHRLAVDSN